MVTRKWKRYEHLENFELQVRSSEKQYEHLYLVTRKWRKIAI
jgi:hypothetical protein